MEGREAGDVGKNVVLMMIITTVDNINTDNDNTNADNDEDADNNTDDDKQKIPG